MSLSESPDDRAPNKGQLSVTLPGVTTFITGHNSEGKAIVHEARSGSWKPFDDNTMAFNQVYTNEFKADINETKDIQAHDELLASGTLGLVKPGGTVCRQVDFSPGYQCMMHRTQSLDFGIVIEGTVEMILNDGSVTLMRRGDVAVQRGTMHAWRNVSKTEWARMQFILQDVQTITVNGERYGEGSESSEWSKDLPKSGND